MRGEGKMSVRSSRSIFSFLMAIILVFSAFASYIPQQTANATDHSVSPVVNEDKTVLFQYENAGAESVQVAGSFTDWQDGALPLEKDESGLWTLLVEGLSAGVYEYKFIVNGGDWLEDPLNPHPIVNGNSQLIIAGMHLHSVPHVVKPNNDYSLIANEVSENGEVTEADGVHWTLSTPVAGVELHGAELSISAEALVGQSFELIASKGNESVKKNVEIIGGMYEYTINYHRIDNELNNWQLWMFDGGLEPSGYHFSETYTVNGQYDFARGTFEFPDNHLKVIPRLGEWETQDAERVIDFPSDQSSAEVWIVQGSSNVYWSEAEAIAALENEADELKRHIRFYYDRSDNDYDDWNIWVWGTGAQDDQIDFTDIKDGKAYVEIAVSSAAEQVGFVLRKGEDWDTAIKDVEPDRFIQLNQNDPVTKVYVTSGQVPFDIVPEVNGPIIENGNVTFYYRDKELYYENMMDTIEQVELYFMGDRYPMDYEANNERFVYTFRGVESGNHEYSFFVTIDGVEREVSDPYNTVDGKSVIYYDIPDVEVFGQFEPAAINYNQNAVLKTEIETEEGIEFQELFADLSGVGGNEKVAIDPQLMEVTIAIDHTVTAGVKSIPIYAVDQFGNTHQGEAELTIETRQFIGESDFDWDEAQIYFLLIDRFFDGDETNNDPYGIGYDTEKRGTYQGGDFKGITAKLDYLEELGINTIWMNPIVENIQYDVRHDDDPETPYYGYHGYWASNFEELNPHFGTMEDFHELIDEAHARGMKIMLDVVLNHTGYGLKESDAGNSHIPYFPTDEDRERFAGMLRAGGSDTVQGELAGLPDFLTEVPEVREQIIEWQVDWIEKSRTPNGNTIDYFRVDTVLHVEDTTWMAFKNELTKEMPEFKMIGEAWGAGQNEDFGYLGTGMMDSLLDFEFKYLARDFANGQLERVQSLLEERNAKLSNQATLGQFLGSHDEAGFLESVDGDLGKLMIAAALQITAKGQPVIYYGEELGLSGLDNYPYYDNRYDMAWDEVEGNEVLAHYQTLLNIRKDNSQLFAKGVRNQIAGSDDEGFLLFERAYRDESIVIGLNTNEEAVEVEVEVTSDEFESVTDLYGCQLYSVVDGKVVVELPAMADGGTVMLVNGEASQCLEEDDSSDDGEENKGQKPEDDENGDDNGHENGGAPGTGGSNNGTISGDESNGKTDGSDSGKLPQTATNFYTWLLVGMILLVSGGALYFIQKRRKVTS